MSIDIKLQNLSAKYLVDYLPKQGWAVGTDDFYLSGQLLADVLPRFGDREGEIKTPDQPRVFTLTTNGQVDFARMTKAEISDYNTQVAKYNQEFSAWCAKPIEKPITLTDKQLAICQKMVKAFMPRSEEDRAKDREKNIERTELPMNEFTFRLCKELKLSPE